MSCKFRYKGKEYSEAEMLAIVSNDADIIQQYKVVEPATTEQSFRGKKPGVEESSNTTSLSKVYSEILARVSNAYKEYMPQNKDQREREYKRASKGTSRFQSVSVLKKEMEELDKVDQKLGLSKYIDWVKSELNILEDVIEQRREKGELTAEKIVSSMRWNDAFSTLKDLQNLANELKRDGTITSEEKRYYDAVLRRMQGQRSSIEAQLVEEERDFYAKLLAKSDTQTEQKYIEKYKKDYKELDIKSSGLGLQEYIQQNLEQDSDEIAEEAITLAKERAHSVDSDLSSMAAKFFSEKNANSKDIQVMSKLVDAVDIETDKFSNSKASEFVKNNKEYLSQFGQKLNQKNKYDMFLTQSDSGNYYLKSKYLPEYIEQKKKMAKDMGDPDIIQEKYGDIEVSKDLKYKINGKSYSIDIFNAFGYQYVEGSTHMEFWKDGLKYNITIGEAIARSEYSRWISENATSTLNKEKTGFELIPKDKWLDHSYKSLSEKESQKEMDQLNWFKKQIKEADENTNGANSLIKTGSGQEWIALPSVLKSDVQRLAEGNLKDLAKHKLKEIVKVQADDTDTQSSVEGRKVRDSIKVTADVSNREKRTVPVHYRAKLKPSDQSLDLHTIILMNSVASKEYQVKKELETTFLIVLDVMKKRWVQDTAGPRRLQKVHAMSEKDAALYKDAQASVNNEAQKMMDIMENRLYNIKNKDAGEIAGANIQQVTRSWLKYSGTVALLGNWINSTINWSMGTVSNFVEATGGEHFGVKDWAKARATYWKDVKGLMQDMSGNKVNNSRTNMFMNFFNVTGDRRFLENKFEETTRLQSLMKMNNLRPFAKGGEHMIQAQLMYATMHAIKVTNNKGQYLNNKGEIVKSKKEAASLDEMIIFKKSKKTGEIKMTLKPEVEATTFTPTGGKDQILLETRNLIKNKILELHGNYDSDLQAAAQREFWGKLTFFLRKWMLPGIHRRWRGFGSSLEMSEDLKEADRFYSQDAKSYREGYYVTAIRFLKNGLWPAIKEANVSLIKAYGSKMSSHEKANVKKLITEMMIIAISFAAYKGLEGDDDDDDDDIVTKYIFRRMVSELSFFINPIEALKIVSTPTASVGTLKRVMQLMVQLSDPNEEYQQGKNKGRSKLSVKALKALPIGSQTEKDIKESLKFLNFMSL